LRAIYAKLELVVIFPLANPDIKPNLGESERVVMATELLYLPSDIPVIQVEDCGYAASADSQTALRPTGLSQCERTVCGLRGNRVPGLLGGLEAMNRAEMIATEKQQADEWRPGFSRRKTKALGYVFHISITGGIAVPPPRLATAMARGTAAEIWERLRPYAEEDDFHGIDLPGGRIIFGHAQEAGHYEEELMVSVPCLQFPDTD